MSGAVAAALISATATITAVVLAAWLSRRAISKQNEKIAEIHVLVNERLELALKEIEHLRDNQV